MSAWTLKNEGESEAIRNLTSESDRGAAIIAGTFVEDRLAQCLMARLRHDTSMARNLSGDFFGINGPIGAFASKIKLGFLMRLYGRQVFNELTAIKDIRNKFAHVIGENAVLSFKSVDIVRLCEKLRIIENYVRPIAELKIEIDPLEARRGSGMMFSDDPSPARQLVDHRYRYTETCGFLQERLEWLTDETTDEFLILGDEPYPLP